MLNQVVVKVCHCLLSTGKREREKLGHEFIYKIFTNSDEKLPQNFRPQLGLLRYSSAQGQTKNQLSDSIFKFCLKLSQKKLGWKMTFEITESNL